MKNIKNSTLFKTPIAHRGLWTNEFPENSMGAFKNATTHGFPIELDVRLSKDEEVVVFHDDSLTRMTGIEGSCEEYDWKSLKEFRLADTDYGIPLFKDVLAETDGKVPLLIEIKNSSKNAVLSEKLINLLFECKGEFAVQSFNPFIVQHFLGRCPVITRGQLSSFNFGGQVSKIKAFIMKRMLLNYKAKPDFVSYNVKNLPNRYVDKCKTQGMAVLAWTVSSQKEYEAIKGYADNIIFEKFIPTV